MRRRLKIVRRSLGPDHDFGSPPILKTLPNGRTILVAGQKSGNVWAHDPDNKGAVIWKTALVSNTSEFGGKIVWGGAADDQNAYFGLGPGGIAAVQLRDGERKWFTKPELAPAMAQHPGHEGPLTAIPGVVFSGAWDGILRALSAADGKIDLGVQHHSGIHHRERSARERRFHGRRGTGGRRWRAVCPIGLRRSPAGDPRQCVARSVGSVRADPQSPIPALPSQERCPISD